jgi:ribonuclease J
MGDNKVRVTVYRGAEEIGGCCTEISYKGTRIAIDFGSPLPEEKAEELKIEGLTYGSSTFDAVLLTHYHGDHVGELGRINADIPVYMGGFAKDIITAYRRHNPRLFTNIDIDRFTDLNAGEEITIGSLQITPILSDHSAAEAFMFLIKAGNFNILHTGDFRLHGRYREELLSRVKEIGRIDLLITEGTTLSRNEDKDTNYTEEYAENKIREYIYENKYCFIILSSTNFERFQGISDSIDRYRKDNKPKGKYFIVDRFQNILFKIAEKRLPERYSFKSKNTYGHNLDAGMEKIGFVMLIRAGNATHKALLRKYLKEYPEKTIIIYSMYTGYLKPGKLKRLTDLAHDKNRLRVVHSSGHVTKQDLASFIDTVAVKNVIVIHTEKNPEMEGLKNLMPVENGKILEFDQ